MAQGSSQGSCSKARGSRLMAKKNLARGPGTTPVGCRGGNRYVEGDLLTFGYLMLNDSLGYPYYRLFNVR